MFMIEFYISFLLGVEHVGGDMFQSVPQGDVIFMKVSIIPFQFNHENIYDLFYTI